MAERHDMDHASKLADLAREAESHRMEWDSLEHDRPKPKSGIRKFLPFGRKPGK